MVADHAEWCDLEQDCVCMDWEQKVYEQALKELTKRVVTRLAGRVQMNRNNAAAASYAAKPLCWERAAAYENAADDVTRIAKELLDECRKSAANVG